MMKLYNGFGKPQNKTKWRLNISLAYVICLVRELLCEKMKHYIGSTKRQRKGILKHKSYLVICIIKKVLTKTFQKPMNGTKRLDL